MVYDRCTACLVRSDKCLLPDSHRAQNRHVWCVDFLLGGAKGKRMKPGVTKKEAEKYEHITIADFERGLLMPQDKGKATLSDVLDRYFTEYAGEQNRNQVATKHYMKVFKGLLGGVQVGTLTLEHLEETRTEYKNSTERSNASVNRAFAILKAALNYAVARGYIKQNPAQYLKHLPVRETIPRFLTLEEISRLRNTITDRRLDDYVSLLLHTGIRPIDLKSLTWAQVDLQNRIVHITTYKGRQCGDC